MPDVSRADEEAVTAGATWGWTSGVRGAGYHFSGAATHIPGLDPVHLLIKGIQIALVDLCRELQSESLLGH